MIAGLVEILLFQGAGEVISRFAVPLIPGPVVGLLLLLGYLVLRRSVPRDVDVVASVLTQHLGLLFVPAAVGVVMYWPNLRTNGLAIAVALVGSVIATIAVTAIVQKLVGRQNK
jgi:holin-like protein